MAGFVIVVVWFFEVMIQFYRQVTGDVPVHPVGWIGAIGTNLFIASWFWALVTSISLLRQAKATETAEPNRIPPPPAIPPVNHQNFVNTIGKVHHV